MRAEDTVQQMRNALVAQANASQHPQYKAYLLITIDALNWVLGTKNGE